FVYTLLASADECLLQGFTMMLLSHQILFIEAIWGGMARPSLKFGSQMMYRMVPGRSRTSSLLRPPGRSLDL
ncbi:hypothetical protein, partial [Pseudomonas savastanoi]|uniref:hypothetical protein n=1 Tax=Pseudomonas savastanoi TaxID=29438 RepID=UPI001C810F0C